MFRFFLPAILLIAASFGAGGTIHACVNNVTGAVRIVASADQCIVGETYTTWGTVGLQGPAGPAGQNGAAGAQGPPGVGDLGCATNQLARWNDASSVWQCYTPPDHTAVIAALQSQVAALEAKLARVTVEDGGTTIRITNANLQIVSGSGATGGAINGRGNLIVGYNEPRLGTTIRTGSHMLVLGTGNNYHSYGGIVAGENNSASGRYASVLGGRTNAAGGAHATVLGGDTNNAFGTMATIGGGARNSASAQSSTVAGGYANEIHPAALQSVISGGKANYVVASEAVISGGEANVIYELGFSGTVSGGYGISFNTRHAWTGNNFAVSPDQMPP